MSVCVTIRSKKSVSPMDIRSRMSTLHPGIEIPDCGEPTSHFYVPGKSIRAVELSKKDNGYEVRILVNSSRYDWFIFRDLISQLLSLTDGKAYMEDDDDEPIEDVNRAFSDETIENNFKNDYSSTKTLSRENDVTIFCVNRQICLGEPLYKMAGINDSTPDDKAACLLENYLLSIQWDRPGHLSTESPMCFAKVRDKGGHLQKISSYVYSDDNPDGYDYIHYDPFFAIYDADNKEAVIIEYVNLHKIVPSSWTLFDKEQYDCKPLTRTEFDEFKAKAKEYSYYRNPEKDGGVSEEMEEKKDIRHVHVDTENVRVAIDVSSEAWILEQGNMRFQIPKYIELQLIYLLYRRKDRVSAAKLLQSVYRGIMVVEDALDKFEKAHVPEMMPRSLALSDLEPLANQANGLVLLSENQKVTVPARREDELLKLLKAKNVDGLIPWFESYLTTNGYDFPPAVTHKHAINLASCYLHFQCLDMDETDPFLGYDKKKVNRRFWLFMIAIIGIVALIFILKSKI